MKFQEFCDVSMENARHVGEGFDEADDDWIPAMFVEEGDGGIAIVVLDPQFLSSEELKSHLAHEVIPKVIHDLHAKRVALLMSVWVKVFDKEARERLESGEEVMKRPAEYADREEAVVVSCFDPMRHATYKAGITRDGVNPPTLGEFELFSDGSAGQSMTGRFIEPIQRALVPQG